MVNNLSEISMNKCNIGQGKFLFQLHLVTFVLTTTVAYISGDLKSGMTSFLFQSEKYAEITSSTNNNDDNDYSYSVMIKLRWHQVG